MADSKATAGSGAAVSATRAELASRGRQRKEKKKKRRASQVLGSALSRFTRGARKQPHDEETTMAELKERARRSASKLKEKVSGPRFNLLLDGAKGLPVREALQATFKIERDRTIKKCVLFMLYFAVLLYTVASVYDAHEAFTTNDAVLDVFLDEPFAEATYKKNFYEIMTHGEFWTWVKGPLLGGLYPDAWYNGDPFTEGERGYVLHNLRVVGGVRLRQMRMPRDSCTERRFVNVCTVRPWNTTTDGPCVNAASYDAAAQTCCVGRFDTKDGRCFTTFSQENQLKTPFGPVDPATGEGKYTWSDGMSDLNGLFGFGEAYGTGGYAVELPTENHLGQASAVVDGLEADRWTDESTYAVAVYFNLYSTNTKLLSAVRFLVEFFNTGHCVKSAKIFTAKLVVYEAQMDKVRLGFEILYLVGLACYIWGELKTFVRTHPHRVYFRRLRSLYELMLIGIQLMMVRQWVLFITATKRQEFDINTSGYVDMYHVAESAQLAYSWAGAAGLAMAIKLFQFMSLSKKLNTLWLTLERAASDLAAFFVGFLVVVCGFAFCAEHIFGFVVADFHNFPASFSTLLRFVLGIFDYQQLEEARPALAPWFFAMHVFVMMLVVLNMFIAIVTKYFDEVHEEVKTADKWQNNAKNFEGAMVMKATLRWAQLTEWCRRRRAGMYGPQSTWWSTQLQSLQAEEAFLKQLNKCRKGAKHLHGIVLFDFFYKMFQRQDADHMYIGVHELCQLVSKSPCPAGKHHMKNRACPAYELLVKYNEWKVVVMLGHVHAHKLLASDITARGVLMFTVTKVNMGGVEQLRIVCLDDQRHALLNFDKAMRLKKSVPLKHLIQIQQSNSDDCHVGLVFWDSTMKHDSRTLSESGELVHVKPETLYNLRFMSAFHKDEFIKKVVAAKTEAMKAAAREEEDSGAGDGGEAEEKASANASARRNSRKKTAALLAGLKRQVEDLVAKVESFRVE